MIMMQEEILLNSKKKRHEKVVIAVMGGAFIIGHRGYNAQLGLRLMDRKHIAWFELFEVFEFDLLTKLCHFPPPLLKRGEGQNGKAS